MLFLDGSSTNLQICKKRQRLGCLYPAFWAPLAAGSEFMHSSFHLFLQFCTCIIRRTIRRVHRNFTIFRQFPSKIFHSAAVTEQRGGRKGGVGEGVCFSASSFYGGEEFQFWPPFSDLNTCHSPPADDVPWAHCTDCMIIVSMGPHRVRLFSKENKYALNLNCLILLSPPFRLPQG